MLSLNLLRVHHSADYIGQLAMKNFKTSNTFLQDNYNYNKIVKSDWLSTALISALIGQFNRTVREVIGRYAPSRARLNGFFLSLLAKQNFEFLVFWFKK